MLGPLGSRSWWHPRSLPVKMDLNLPAGDEIVPSGPMGVAGTWHRSTALTELLSRLLIYSHVVSPVKRPRLLPQSVVIRSEASP